MKQHYELYAIRLNGDGRFVAAPTTRNREFRRLLRETKTPLDACRLVRQEWTRIDPRQYVFADERFDMEGYTLHFERGEGGVYYMPAWCGCIEDYSSRLWDCYLEYTSGLKGLERLLFV